MLIPYFQIRSNAIVLYQQSDEHHGRRAILPKPKANTYGGTVTKHAKKRLLSALDLLVQRSDTRRIYNPVSESFHDFKLAFITLTVADERNITAREAYDNLLREWLRYMKAKQGLKDYVWKAELQRRGQIHYHVATSTFIPWETVRWRWNQLQRRNGYLDKFGQKFKHFNPNSTDIHSMVNVNDCLAYIGKEMCKDVQNQAKTTGKIWDCNEDLKRGRYSDTMPWYMEDLIGDAIQMGFATEIKNEHCTIIKTPNPTLFLNAADLSRYQRHIS